MVGRLSSAPSLRPSLWPWIGGVPSVLSVLGARRGPHPPPPSPCALSGAAWVSQLRPLQARFAQLCPRSSTTPSPVTYVVGVAVPAAFMQLRLRRLCCIGTWAPKALRLVVVWVTSGEERRRSLGYSRPKLRCALRSYRSVLRNCRRSICSSLVQGEKRVASLVSGSCRGVSSDGSYLPLQPEQGAAWLSGRISPTLALGTGSRFPVQQKL